jgi:hypothetical protein
MKATQVMWAFLASQLFSPNEATAIPKDSSVVSRAFAEYTNNVVFQPLPNHESWGTIYARTIQLPDGSHLLSWEDYSPEPPLMAFPIYRSTDNGVTWSNFSQVKDQVNGWGNRYQPEFYALKNGLGDYPAGTIMFGGMSVRKDLGKAWLDIYTSADSGTNWNFASHVAYAPGPETVKNGDKAVWEPFFLMHEGQLVCYYSDQRDTRYAQKLVYVTTTNLKDWSEPADAVTYSTYEYRPGMATVAYVKSTGKYIMTYELCGTSDGGCPSYYKVASSPYEFNSVEGTKVIANTGENPGSSPYIIWTEHPTRNDGSGVILMNGAQNNAIYINDDAAAPNGWRSFDVDQQSAHSRMLEIITVDGAKKLMLAGAGQMESGADNYVSVGVIDIPY